ncbi:hypothetical protein EIP91_005922 [Steccherinum ochraceum]|uniref:Uncharacterized protein n=1 Tax=Steccherinum ochraceum TaxID=92696 RepID=A0A4R0RTR3_9APHY|nr:hypothetical protein EIP91_005922 [Steccherinum ochraceum]
MSGYTKRKWSQVEDSDDDEPSLGKQVLPIANLPLDFNGEPMDGLQYLFTVRRNAKSLPHTTRVHNPYEVKEEPKERTPPRSLSSSSIPMPSDEWRDVFLRRFRNFRKNSLQPTTRIGVSTNGGAFKLIPDKKDRDAWWAFISGRPEVEWNPPKKPKAPTARQQRQQRYTNGRGMRAFSDEWTAVEPTSEISYGDSTFSGGSSVLGPTDPSDSLPTPSGTPAPGDAGDSSSATTLNISISQREPTPTLLRNIDHRYSLHLLMYFTHWINVFLEQPQPRNTHMTEAHARWMFSLLSRVEDYVTADETSLLRSLARACMSFMKDALLQPSSAPQTDMDDERMSVRSCWFILVIVVDIWAQRDLWMDLEDMLATIKPS